MSISYFGYKTRSRVGGQIVVRYDEELGDTVLDPYSSQKLYNHSPDGFQWGYYGSGPAQLALAILLDTTEDGELSIRLHQSFKEDKIASLEDRFVLTQQEILDWLKGTRYDIR